MDCAYVFVSMPLQYSLCNDPLIELSNPGASGSIFYVSSDDEFIIKTVQHKEAEFLQKLLPGYFMVCNFTWLHLCNLLRLVCIVFMWRRMCGESMWDMEESRAPGLCFINSLYRLMIILLCALFLCHVRTWTKTNGRCCPSSMDCTVCKQGGRTYALWWWTTFCLAPYRCTSNMT